MEGGQRARKVWRQAGVLSLVLLVSVFSTLGVAQVDYIWIGAPGGQDWGTATNWSPNAVPGDGDNAYLEPNDANDRTASFRNIHPPGTTLNVISVNALVPGI